jgi:hypothetical protein
MTIGPMIGMLAVMFGVEPGATVEVEEVVATCASPNNGAGPLWCYGAPMVVRLGDDVFASVMETGQGVPPLCNTRWRLYHRDANGWSLARAPEGFRNREPCPLANTGRGQLVLSVNPSTQPPGTQFGRCDPHLLRFDASHPERGPEALRPTWPKSAHFTDHSYRGLATDARRGEILALNIDATTSVQHWALGNADGDFSRTGTIAFPIRACYPQVALRDGAAHVMAIGDVVEPVAAWRDYKKEKTGRAWDYVFRRLFYTGTPDIARRDFAEPVEIDSAEATAGHITNLDLWIDPEGKAHLLYLKTNLTPLLRDRFFPGRKIATALEHVEVDDGKVVARSTLLAGGEGARETPHYARFHAAGDGTLKVVAYVSGTREDGSSFAENRLVDARPGAKGATALPLKSPFSIFFTAAERGGNRPSDTLDLFGIAGDGNTLRYARVRLGGPASR